MNKTLKATLLSAFVLPGSGHLLLKRYVSATLFAAITLLSSYQLISIAITNATLLVEKMQLSGVIPDVATITQLAEQQTTASGMFSGDTLSTILLFTWIISIIDSYRIGRLQEKNKEKNNH